MTRSKQRNNDIAQVISSEGFASEVFKVIAHAVMAQGGDMQHLRRIMNEPALQRQIADLLVPTGFAEERPLGRDEYLVPVGYDMPRDKEKLEAELSKDGVPVTLYLYDDCEWRLHSSCAEIDQAPGNRVMLLKDFGRSAMSEVIIAKMDKRGYRPATHLEACAFAKANPALQHRFSIVALGSSAASWVAKLSGDSKRRYFGLEWFGLQWWPSNTRFLFVRK